MLPRIYIYVEDGHQHKAPPQHAKKIAATFTKCRIYNKPQLACKDGTHPSILQGFQERRPRPRAVGALELRILELYAAEARCTTDSATVHQPN